MEHASIPSKMNSEAAGGTGKRIVRYVLLVLMLLGFEFDIHFYGPISMRKISFLIFLLLAVNDWGLFYAMRSFASLREFLKTKWNSAKARIKGFFGRVRHFSLRKWFGGKTGVQKFQTILAIALCLLPIYYMIIFQFNIDNTRRATNRAMYPSYFLGLAISLLGFSFIMSRIFRSFEEFCKVQLGLILCQACVALVCRVSLPVSYFFFENFTSGGHWTLADGIRRRVRVPIFGSIGAIASWVMFLGLIACGYLLVKTKKIRYIFCYGIILFSMLFVGRTGLYLGILFLGFIFLYLIFTDRRAAKGILILGAIGIVLVAAFLIFTPDIPLKHQMIDWVGEIFVSGFGHKSTMGILREMGIPPLSWETFWGTSIFFGLTKGMKTLCISDSGYIRNYMAMGLVGSLVYYVGIYGLIFTNIRRVDDKLKRRLLWCLMFFVVLAEYKEPFLYNSPNGMVLIALTWIELRSQKKKASALQ